MNVRPARWTMLERPGVVYDANGRVVVALLREVLDMSRANCVRWPSCYSLDFDVLNSYAGSAGYLQLASDHTHMYNNILQQS